MTNKDAMILARGLNALLPNDGIKHSTAEGVFKSVITIIASVCKEDDPHFNKNHFLDRVYKGMKCVGNVREYTP